jgi:hypothetical protein
MKTKLKHIFLFVFLGMLAASCGGRMSKPTSGLDVSILSPRLLSISPEPPGQQSGVQSGQTNPVDPVNRSEEPAPGNPKQE